MSRDFIGFVVCQHLAKATPAVVHRACYTIRLLPSVPVAPLDRVK